MILFLVNSHLTSHHGNFLIFFKILLEFSGIFEINSGNCRSFPTPFLAFIEPTNHRGNFLIIFRIFSDFSGFSQAIKFLYYISTPTPQHSHSKFGLWVHVPVMAPAWPKTVDLIPSIHRPDPVGHRPNTMDRMPATGATFVFALWCEGYIYNCSTNCKH